MCDAPASAEALHAAWCDECVAALVVRAGIASFGPPPGLTGRMRISMHAFEHAHRWLRFVRLLLPSQVSRTDALLAAGAPFSEYAVGCRRLGPRIGPPLARLLDRAPHLGPPHGRLLPSCTEVGRSAC